jgi:hypothetical protein
MTIAGHFRKVEYGYIVTSLIIIITKMSYSKTVGVRKLSVKKPDNSIILGYVKHPDNEKRRFMGLCL